MGSSTSSESIGSWAGWRWICIETLRNQTAGAAEGTVAYTLAAIKDWTFLLGPGWVVALGNGLILGYMMYRTGLVPRRWCWLGLIGGPLLILFGTAVMFTGNNPSSSLATLKNLSALPEGVWELFLGVYAPSGASAATHRFSRERLPRSLPKRPRFSRLPKSFVTEVRQSVHSRPDRTGRTAHSVRTPP
jgi:hypothetical protein